MPSRTARWVYQNKTNANYDLPFDYPAVPEMRVDNTLQPVDSRSLGQSGQKRSTRFCRIQSVQDFTLTTG